MITYQKLFNNPVKLLRLTGFNIVQFKILAERLKPLWNENEFKRLFNLNRKRKIGGGRKYHLKTIEDKLLLILVWYRTYVIFELLGLIFNFDPTNIGRLVRKLIPLVEKSADSNLRFALRNINKGRKKIRTWEEFARKYPDLIEIIIDATEQKRRRPKNKRRQKTFYSGKKHQHSFKTQITVSKNGLILNVSKTYSGRIHDKTVLIEEKTIDKIPEDIKKYLDRGYQRIQEEYKEHKINLPIKRNRWKKTLTRGEKIKNTKQAKKRIIVEHVLSRMKKYRILSDTYRSSENEYNQHFKNIASLCNFRLMFKEMNTS